MAVSPTTVASPDKGVHSCELKVRPIGRFFCPRGRWKPRISNMTTEQAGSAESSPGSTQRREFVRQSGGEIDAAHVLYRLVYGVPVGIGGAVNFHVAVGRDVVPHPASAPGPAKGRPRLPGHGGEDRSGRALPRGREPGRRAAAPSFTKLPAVATSRWGSERPGGCMP